MSAKRIEGYSNTMLAYSVEIEQFENDGWVVLDQSYMEKADITIYLIGYPDDKIQRREPFHQENKPWNTGI